MSISYLMTYKDKSGNIHHTVAKYNFGTGIQSDIRDHIFQSK